MNSRIKSESTALDNKNMKDYQEILFPVFSITLAKRKCVLSLLSGVSLLPYGLWSLRLLCPRDFPGKNTGVGCHFLLQGILQTPGSSPGLLHCKWFLYQLSHQRNLENLDMAMITHRGFPDGSVVKNLPATARGGGHTGLIPRSGRSPGGGNGKPL